MSSAANSETPLYMGVDGGGTGCRARLETIDGLILGRGIAGPAATRFGIDASWAAISTSFQNALDEANIAAEDVKHIRAGIGVAGLSRQGALEALKSQEHPFASISFATDVEIACLGAHAGKEGAIVIVGTGSCGLGRISGQWIKLGGYGFPISDEGSGAYLGLRAIRAALMAHDGRQNKTALLEEVMSRFNNDPNQAVQWMDQATATEYAAFAPIVVRHAEYGDPSARRIMQDAAAAIEGICRTLFEKGAPRLSLIGGLASVVESWLAPDLRNRLNTQIGDSLDGAMILAGRPVFETHKGGLKT